ncbi:hypothetical protein L6164_013095 [Bauhinia variegata]|uniref:Uncharacterized protein n=1 Tax=Bauhinia variegata TaxID=167791 RepID=A0ACB9PC16_BAUVA|nr:hypothetical protein L6164_013095 [Bauhinia variegata]
MAETEANSSSSEQVRLLHLKLPILTHDDIKIQVQQTYSSTSHSSQFRRLRLVSISNIIKPATHFVDSILLIENSTGKDDEMFDEIDVDQALIHTHQYLSGYSWDGKEVINMANLALEFVELLEFLLHGPKGSSIELGSSMAALKENPVSLVGTPIEKFQQPLDQLNCLIKITLELTQYIGELTLLQDTEYSREVVVSMGVYSAILKEMEARVQSFALFDDIFENGYESFDSPIDILELMKRLTYSKDGHQSLIDGSTMSKLLLPCICLGFCFGWMCWGKSGAAQSNILDLCLDVPVNAAPANLPKLYMNEPAEGRTKGSQKAGVQSSYPSGGFKGLLSVSQNKRG